MRQTAARAAGVRLIWRRAPCTLRHGASFGNAPPPCLTPRRRSDLLCPSRDNLQVHEGPRGTFVGDATEVRARQ